MTKKDKEEYYFLTDKLEEIIWALDGKCNDIDCDRYIYKDLLKKKYLPVLEHNFSCIEHLNRDKVTVMRLLSQKKFRKYRYERCSVCNKILDKLSDKNTIVSFTRPSQANKKYYEWQGVWTHRNCASKFKVPDGWKRN